MQSLVGKELTNAHSLVFLSPSLPLSLLSLQFPIVALLGNMAVQHETVTQPQGVSVTVDTSLGGLEDSAKVRPGRDEHAQLPHLLLHFSALTLMLLTQSFSCELIIAEHAVYLQRIFLLTL